MKMGKREVLYIGLRAYGIVAQIPCYSGRMRVDMRYQSAILASFGLV